MNGQTDRAALGGDGPGDALADPPVGVGAEAETTGGIELFHGPLQPERSLLDQIQDFHAPLLVLLGHRHHQAQVGLNHVVFGSPPVAEGQLQILSLQLGLLSPGLIAQVNPLLQLGQGQSCRPGPFLLGWPVAVLVGFPALQFFETVQFTDGGIALSQLPLLEQQCFAALHQTGQGDLLLIGEQVDPADVLEIKPQQIRCAAAAALTGPPGPSGLAGQKLAL